MSVCCNCQRKKKEHGSCFVVDVLKFGRDKNKMLQLDASVVMFIMPLQPRS